MVALTGKLRGWVLMATGVEGTDPGWAKVTFITWPWFVAGPHPPEPHTTCRSAKYKVPSGVNAIP
jgi:hypothetical protein